MRGLSCPGWVFMLLAACSATTKDTADTTESEEGAGSCAPECAEEERCEDGHCVSAQCLCDLECECTTFSASVDHERAGECDSEVTPTSICLEVCEGLMNQAHGTCDTEWDYDHGAWDPTYAGEYRGAATVYVFDLWEGSRDSVACEGEVTLDIDADASATGSLECADNRSEINCEMALIFEVPGTSEQALRCEAESVEVDASVLMEFELYAPNVLGSSERVAVRSDELGDFEVQVTFNVEP